MTEAQRRTSFENLVLRGIWLLILRAFGANPRVQATSLRANMINYFDEVGNSSDDAKKYRREDTFPELRV